jgi:hypothetical protein
MAHKLVVETAKELAHAMYGDIMQADNTLYAGWKQQCAELTPACAEQLFVELMYPKLIEQARATLGRMLGDPTMQAVHETLYEALTKDYLFTQGRRAKGRQVLVVADDGTVTTRKSPLN